MIKIKSVIWQLNTILYTLIFLLSYSNRCFPQDQQLRFEHLSSKNGLTQNRVNSILQDKTGYLWFGTYDGLNRYDGYEFKAFRYNPYDSATISGNEINVLYEDNAGNIWIGAGGLTRYNPKNESFQRFIHVKGRANSLSSNNVSAICEDRLGNIWAGTEDAGLNCLSFAKDSNSAYNMAQQNASSIIITRMRHSDNSLHSIDDDRINALLPDSDYNLWVGTDKGLYLIMLPRTKADTNSLNFGNLNFPIIRYILKDINVISLYRDSAKVLWIGTKKELIKYEYKSGNTKSTHYPIENNNFAGTLYINCIVKRSKNELWLGTNNGLIIFNPLSGKYRTLYYNADNPGSISSNNILSAYIDRSGIIWLGTSGRGISKYTGSRKAFEYYPCSSANNKTSSIRTIIEDVDKNIRVINSEHRLFILDKNSGRLDNSKLPIILKSPQNDMVADKNGLLWIAGNNRIYSHNTRSGRLREYVINPYARNDETTFNALKLYCDADNSIWVLTAQTLFKLNKNNGTFDKYKLENYKQQTVYNIYLDSEKIFWFATNDGLWKYDLDSRTISVFRNDGQKNKSISNNTVFSILPDPLEPKRYLWLGTAGGGLNRLDKIKNEFKYYCEQDGLPNNFVYGILSDSSNNLWVSTNHGLSKFTIKSETFRNYDYQDGLQDNEFNSQSFFKTNDGKMYFGGINGITSFYPHKIKDNTYIPPVIFSGFAVAHNSVSHKSINSPLKQPIQFTKQIHLSYKQNNISFKFTALDYTSPGKNRYAYKMDNFDKNWIYIGTLREAFYSNLPPGNYTFHVKGSNSDGIWNEAGNSIKISITPPFWQTIYAYLLYLAIIILLIYSARRYELNRIRLRNRLQFETMEKKKLKELNNLMSAFFTGISHEFRTPLTLIIGPTEQLLLNTVDEKKRQMLAVIKRNALRLLRLINQLLDLSRSEAGEMKLKIGRSDITEFTRNLTMQFSSLAQQKDISISFSAEERILMYFDQEVMEKILINLLSNAVKFTANGGKININVSRQTKKLNSKETIITNTSQTEFIEIKISDSGIGIGEEQLEYIFNRFYQVGSNARNSGSGIGLALVKDLTALHQGIIKVESRKHKGTTFTLWFPAGKDHFIKEHLLSISESAPMIKEQGENLEEIFLLRENGNTPEKYSDILDHPKTIVLVIDDHPELRTYIRECLESDYKIIEAENGKEGLEKAVAIIPDLIISDVMMPEMDGYQVAEAIKADERTSHIPVILLTAKAKTEEKIEGLQTGADDYLLKPFHVKELQIRVQNLIETRRILQERYKNTITLKPSKSEAKSLDEIFLQKILANIEKHIEDENYTVEILSSEVGMSPSQIYRKIRALTNQTTTQIIQSVRLQRAAELLKQNAGNISEIAYSVGFSSPAYFSKVFKEKFNCTPQAYAKS